MKSKYVRTNFAEITPAVAAHYKIQSKKQGITLIPLAAHAAVPRTQKQRDADEAEATPPGPLINLNTASKADLATLDGIGEAGAERVIKHRPFESVDVLTRVGGIGQKTVDKLREFLTV